MKTYVVSYRHEGAEWLLELKAASASDARQRLMRLASATIGGELVATVDARVGWLARLVVWGRNLIRLVHGAGHRAA